MTGCVCVSADAPAYLTNWLRGAGYTVVRIRPDALVHPAIAAHPDLFMCRMGTAPNAPVLFSRPNELGSCYPADIPYNAVCLDRYLIHRTDCTAPAVRAAAAEMGLREINVRQGYTRCSTVVVDGRSVITADPGIAETLRAYPDIDVLQILPGHVLLPGFPEGFLGGASGRVGRNVVFCGDIKTHPEHERIAQFIRARDLNVVSFPGQPLLDIGGIIETGALPPQFLRSV